MPRLFESCAHRIPHRGLANAAIVWSPGEVNGVGAHWMRPWGIGTRQMPHPLESGDIPAHRTGILPMLHLFEARGETYGVGARWMGQGALAPAGEAMAS